VLSTFCGDVDERHVVSRPLIPEFALPDVPILVSRHVFEVFGHVFDVGPFSIKPFGILVALGVYAGVFLAGRMARARGIPPLVMSRFQVWVLVCAFVLGHVLDVAFYHPLHIK